MIDNPQTGSLRHLSFSATLQREDGMILLVRRPLFDSLHESTTSVWGHSFFGSPRFAEPLPTAVKRCAEQELGILSMSLEPLRPLLTEWPTADPTTARARPSYLVHSAEQPAESLPFDMRWADPLAEGEKARRNPEEYSHMFFSHATLLPFFGGTTDSLDTITQLQRRATG